MNKLHFNLIEKVTFRISNLPNKYSYDLTNKHKSPGAVVST